MTEYIRGRGTPQTNVQYTTTNKKGTAKPRQSTLIRGNGGGGGGRIPHVLSHILLYAYLAVAGSIAMVPIFISNNRKIRIFELIPT